MASLLQFAARGYADPFYGNPNVNISSITPVITLSRSSGYVPAFVQVSASAFTAIGTSRPYEDLEFTIDFGDSTGELVFDPVLNRFVNANSQMGPEAVYVYRSANTYTITVTAKGKKTGGYVTASAQTTFTASDNPWPHYYFDGNAGSDGDGTIGSPWNDPVHILWNTTPALRGVTSGFGANLHVKRDTVVNCSGDNLIYCYGGQLRMDAYGTGADPKFVGTALSHLNGDFAWGGVFQISTQSSNRATNDIVLSNIQLQVTDHNDCISCNALGSVSPNFIRDVYFDGCTFYNNLFVRGLNGSLFANSPIGQFGFWKCTSYYNPNLATDYIHGDMPWWCFNCAMTFIPTQAYSGGLDNTVHTHYVSTVSHSLFKWCKFDVTMLQNHLKVSINISDGDGPYHCVSSNYFYGRDGTSPGRSNEISNFKNYQYFVIEKNLFHNWRAVAVDIEDPATYTVRFNYFSSPQVTNECISTRQPCYIETSLYVYGNYFYGKTQFTQFTNFGWQLANTVTDNINYNTANAGSASQCVQMVQADQVAAGTFIDRNQYYSAITNQLFSIDGGTSNVTWANWQNLYGWDINGVLLAQAPNWPDPANGNFGQR